MLRSRRAAGLAGVLAVAVLVLSAAAAAHPGHQHGPDTGHLIGSGAWGNIELVSKLRMHDIPVGTAENPSPRDVVADVAVFKNYAYVARWGGPDCAGPETGGKRTPDGGAYIVDISNLAAPKEVGFIRTHQDTLVGEGMQGLTLNTSAFSGDVLLMNHEDCGKNFKAGFSIWNITNPLKPTKLSEHIGDVTINGAKITPQDVNTYHSVFGWTSADGSRAFLVATDNEEGADVDIYEITNPKKPVLISETDLNTFDVAQPELGLTDSFLHDMVVKRIGNRDIMLLSYWDGGYVTMDVTNPASPTFLSDTDYPAVDPLLLERTGTALTPEGNAHQGEFTLDSQFAITTDEDFGPFRLNVTTPAGTFRGAPGTQTSVAQATAVSGTTVWVGRACPGDPAVPSGNLFPGTSQIAVVERGLCFFEDKAQTILAAGGWEAMLIVNREGSDACTGVFTPSLTASIPTLFVGRDSGFAMFGVPYDQTACADATQNQAPITIGTLGAPVTSVATQFDGWGYVHLWRVNNGGESLTSLDTYAINEAHDPAFASGFGDLSVHEVATDQQDSRYAYLSYYMGGIRSLQIVGDQLVEVGGYLDPKGNNFWGIETFVRDGVSYAVGSDMDSGIFIVKRKP